MDLRETQTPSTGFKANMAYFAYKYSQLLRSFKMIASLLFRLITFVCNHCSYSGLKCVEVEHRCPYSDYVTGWTTGTRFPARTKIFFFVTSRTVLGKKRRRSEVSRISITISPGPRTLSWHGVYLKTKITVDYNELYWHNETSE